MGSTATVVDAATFMVSLLSTRSSGAPPPGFAGANRWPCPICSRNLPSFENFRTWPSPAPFPVSQTLSWASTKMPCSPLPGVPLPLVRLIFEQDSHSTYFESSPPRFDQSYVWWERARPTPECSCPSRPTQPRAARPCSRSRARSPPRGCAGGESPRRCRGSQRQPHRLHPAPGCSASSGNSGRP